MPGMYADADVVAANTTTDNIFAGNQFEFPEVDCYIDIGFTISATGLYVSVFFAGRTIARDLLPNVRAAAPANPVYPDDYFILNEPCLAGERLTCQARNTTGGNITVLTVMRQKAG